MEWKTGIWLEPGKLHKYRVLRPAEAREIFMHVDIRDEGNYKTLQKLRARIRNEDVIRWFQALLFTGMRFTELVRFYFHEEWYERDGTISIPRIIFDAPDDITGKVAKNKVVAAARTVYLSDKGREIVKKFLESRPLYPREQGEAAMDRVKASLDHILKKAAIGAGCHPKEFTVTRKVYERDKHNQFVYEEGPSGKRKKFSTVTEEILSYGVSLRSFRKSWESWLINTYGDSQRMAGMITRSMGHTQETQLRHYASFQFDSEDMEEIKQMVRGFGTTTMGADHFSPSSTISSDELREFQEYKKWKETRQNQGTVSQEEASGEA